MNSYEFIWPMNSYVNSCIWRILWNHTYLKSCVPRFQMQVTVMQVRTPRGPGHRDHPHANASGAGPARAVLEIRGNRLGTSGYSDSESEIICIWLWLDDMTRKGPVADAAESSPEPHWPAPAPEPRPLGRGRCGAVTQRLASCDSGRMPARWLWQVTQGSTGMSWPGSDSRLSPSCNLQAVTRLGMPAIIMTAIIRVTGTQLTPGRVSDSESLR